MKTIFATVSILLFSMASAQDYPNLLLADPYLSNGYFMADVTEMNNQNISYINVDFVANVVLANGAWGEQVLESFTLNAENWYANADLGLLETLNSGDNAFYKLTAYNAEDIEVWDYEAQGSTPWTESCRETCNAPAYSWTLVAYSDVSLGQTNIQLQHGSTNGNYNYFYVATSDWSAFQAQYDPSDFGLANDWSFLETASNQTEVVHFDPVPSGAKDIVGNPLDPNSTGAWGIRKDAGPWRELVPTSTSGLTGGPGQFCASGSDYLSMHYNADTDVQIAMNLNGMDPLTCAAFITTGGGTSWGAGQEMCNEITIETQFDPITGEVDIVSWAIEVVACDTPSFGLWDLQEIRITPWDDLPPLGSGSITIPIYDQDDPKLVSVPRTELVPGLYEFLIVMDNGTLIRHFEAFDQSVVMNADFASFTNVTIYPVPVIDNSFAVDIELLAPMDINLSVINNMGENYHSELLQYNKAGRNKHVIKMANQWPSGIYHCMLQYPDGSTDTITFTVE